MVEHKCCMRNRKKVGLMHEEVKQFIVSLVQISFSIEF